MYTLPDSYIRPGARCVICTVSFDKYEKVALVTGTEWTEGFEFPDAKAVVTCAVFSRHGKREGRLCYNPFQCSNSSTFHPQCFRESQVPGSSYSLHLSHIWRYSLWARPWKTAPSLDDFEASQPIPYVPTILELESADTNNDLLWIKLYMLPPEIKQEIMAMAYGSLLWRLFAARRWRERLSFLIGDLVTWSITDIKSWKRGQQFESHVAGPKVTEDVITVAIDNLGIRSLEVSNSWPFAGSNQAKNNCVYIVEPYSTLRELRLEQQGHYCRFQNVNRPLRLWDTPAPPHFNSCRFRDDQTPPLRLKTIVLNTSLQGLSVFSYNGSTYGIYPHYSNDPSPILNIFNQIQARRQKPLIWLFCPLSQQKIKDAWLRYDSILTYPPILVLRTTRDQIYTFGPYRDSDCRFQYLGSMPSHIVVESVPLGEQIPAFGIATDVYLDPSESPQPCHTSSPPSHIEDLYSCSALLGEIQWVIVYCTVEGYCVGLMIGYTNGLQHPLGQCRPDANGHKVESPFGFHHQSKAVSRQQKEKVYLSKNRQEYKSLAKDGWESTEISNKLTRLSWWYNETSSFCSVSLEA